MASLQSVPLGELLVMAAIRRGAVFRGADFCEVSRCGLLLVCGTKSDSELERAK